MAEQTKAGAKTSANFEVALRKRARPMLSAEERKELARQKGLETAQMASARCREAAAAQQERAEAWDREIRKLESGR